MSARNDAIIVLFASFRIFYGYFMVEFFRILPLRFCYNPAMKFLTSMLLVSIFSIATSAQSSSTNTKAEAAILAVMNEQAKAWNNGDIGGYMLGYWNSEKLTFVSGDYVTRGWQPTFDRYKKSYDTRVKMGTLSFSSLEIDVLSKDVAVVLGSWSLARVGDNPHGKFTLVFRKFKEGWRIVRDHTS